MPDSQQIDMSGLCLAPDLTFGCIRLRNADSLPLSGIFVTASGSEASITFTGDNPKPWDKHTLVSVRMFNLPDEQAEFQRLIEWFGRNRQERARLPERVAFNTATLAVREASDVWEHEAFPRSGRDFIHVYRTARQGVLIRWMGKSGTILDNPVIRGIHENLSLVEGQWVQEFPVVQRREPSAARATESPLPPELEAQVEAAATRARERLNLEPTASPQQTAEAIHRVLDEIRSRPRLSADEKQQIAIDLGALWGNALCAAAGWEWCSVSPEPDREVPAVCSPTRSHAVDPLQVAYAILESKSGTNNSLLLFNMIVAGDVPVAAEGAYSWLS